MLKTIIIATALLTAAVPAIADVITYDCAIKGNTNIEERLIVSVDTGNKTAMAFNGMIKHSFNEPIAVNFVVLRNGKYQLRWSIHAKGFGRQTVRADYEVRLDPSTRKLAIKINFPFVGPEDEPRGKGTCKILKGETLF